MIKEIEIEQFLVLKKSYPVLDVRSPVEYFKGHVPESINIPLFSNEERAHIGTVYKEKGSIDAVLLGESYADPKISEYLDSVSSVFDQSPIIVICFRGGMRSRRFAELLDNNGFDVYRLIGGYKSYKHFIQNFFSNLSSLIVIGGMTGTGKTEILHELKNKGEQIIDLEYLANHRGSAFGSIKELMQPSTEQFENNLFKVLSEIDIKKRIWVEDESRNIGRVFLPEKFYEQLREAPLIILELDKKFRAMRLSRDYGCEENILLKDALNKTSWSRFWFRFECFLFYNKGET